MSNSFKSRICGNAILVLLLWLTSCKTGNDTQQLSDFRAGAVYQLKVPACVMAHTGLVVTLEDARQKPPSEVESLLEPGTFFKVQQIVATKDRATGPKTEIYSQIVSGPNKGRVVNLRTASREDGRGVTRRNPAVLQPFFGQ